jgi:hypothetical protein
VIGVHHVAGGIDRLVNLIAMAASRQCKACESA